MALGRYLEAVGGKRFTVGQNRFRLDTSHGTPTMHISARNIPASDE
jgi:hypothetical protein